jgi:hypothetical protein
MEEKVRSDAIVKEVYRPFEKMEGQLTENEMWSWIGKKVYFDRVYKRDVVSQENPPYSVFKEWKIKEITKPNYFVGKIIGFRNIQTGYVYRDYEYGPEFKRLKTHYAIQVITNARQNPKLVPYEGILVK